MSHLRRLGSLCDPVTVRVNGWRIRMERGEPLAVGIQAGGTDVLSRSVKYHRPRGALCYQGECDGCLMRVNGLPSQLTCIRAAQEGDVVTSQNSWGTARWDLLALTDWMFPRGMDHHHLALRPKAVNRLMQWMARRIAGVGELPGPQRPRPEVAAPASNEVWDAVVIGGGLSGLRLAARLGETGLRVQLFEQMRELGGHTRLLDSSDASEGLRRAVEGVRRQPSVRVSTCHKVIAVYPDRRVVVDRGQGRLQVVRPQTLGVATGLRQVALPVAGNDLPGCYTAVGLLELMKHGLCPTGTVAILGQGRWGSVLQSQLQHQGAQTVFADTEDSSLVGVHGRSGVRGLGRRGRKRLACDLVAFDGPESGRYELAAQAGAGVRWSGKGFEVEASAADGATCAKWVYAVGSCADTERSPTEPSLPIHAAAEAMLKIVRMEAS